MFGTHFPVSILAIADAMTWMTWKHAKNVTGLGYQKNATNAGNCEERMKKKTGKKSRLIAVIAGVGYDLLFG